MVDAVRERPLVRVFASFHYPQEDFVRLFPPGVLDVEFDYAINQSGPCDLAIVLGFAPLGSWVKVPENRVFKFILEPWHPGIFFQFVRHHASFFNAIFSPHVSLDKDPRVKPLFGNLDWHAKKSYDDFQHLEPPTKRRLLSIILSSKADLPGHRLRTQLAKELEAGFPNVVRFGRGTSNELGDKLDGLLDFKYSVALENSCQENYVTEKFFDCVLAWTVPIYLGAPNINTVFPDGSFIVLDPSDMDGSLGTLRDIISDPGDYYSRLEALAKARSIVLDELSFLARLRTLLLIIPSGVLVKQRLWNRDSLLFWLRDAVHSQVSGALKGDKREA